MKEEEDTQKKANKCPEEIWLMIKKNSQGHFTGNGKGFAVAFSLSQR